MQIVFPNQANEVGLPLVEKTTGDPITSGTINFYLKRLDTKKWFRGLDSTWQDTEAIAGVGTHDSDGHWYVVLESDPWEINVRYKLYAKESGNLHITVGEEVYCRTEYSGSGNVKKIYTVTDSDGNPIDGVDVWVTIDIEGTNTIASGITNIQGEVYFYLNPGTYYIWSQKAGYNFINPDTEEVT